MISSTYVVDFHEAPHGHCHVQSEYTKHEERILKVLFFEKNNKFKNVKNK
jgi:hypothetical protein